MELSLNGKVAVITGAAGGIGTGLVRRFLQEGASVALCDLKTNEEAAAAMERECGGRVKCYAFDITAHDAVSAAMQAIENELGPIGVLVNNAGINVGPDERKTVENFSDEWWEAILKVDLDGTYLCTKEAVKHAAENLAIVNISSIVGMVPLRNQCAFAAAKAAVINFTKAAAMELAPKGIRVNAVCPGSVGIAITNRLWQKNSAMEGLISHIPMGRQGAVEEIASAVAFLASKEASYITGAVLPVDGGWTCGGFARDF